MSGTFKMTKLDYYTAKSLIVENIVVIFVITAIFSFLRSSVNTLCFTAAWYAALSATNIFMIQDKNGLERLYTSLSLDRSNIICGRYLFCYIQYLIILVLTVIVGVGAMFIFFGDTIQFLALLSAVCESLLIFTAMTCIQIPVCIRLPYSKARFWCMIVLMIVVALFTCIALNMSLAGNVVSIKINQGLLSAIYVAVSIAALIISYPISMCCYRNRMRTK